MPPFVCQRSPKLPDTNFYANRCIFQKKKSCHICRHFEFLEICQRIRNQHPRKTPDTNFYESAASYKVSQKISKISHS